MLSRNQPHPYNPFQVVAIGQPGSHAWTVQFPGTGYLSACRFARAAQAEEYANILASVRNYSLGLESLRNTL